MTQIGKYLDRLEKSVGKNDVALSYWAIIVSLIEDKKTDEFKEALLRACKKFFPKEYKDEESYISGFLKKKYHPDDSFNFGQKLLNVAVFFKSEKIMNYLLDFVDPFEVVDAGKTKSSCFRETVPKHPEAAYQYLFRKGLISGSDISYMDEGDNEGFWSAIYQHVNTHDDTIKLALGEVAEIVSDSLIEYA